MSLSKRTGKTQKFDSHTSVNMFLHFEVRHIHSKFCQLHLILSRSKRPEVFCKKGVLRNFAEFTGKRLCQSLFFNKVTGLRPAALLKKEALAQAFSFEFYETSKNTFSCRTPPVVASACPHLWSQRYELEVSFNFVKQRFYGNSSLTHYHIVINWVRCKIFSGKWGLKMNGKGLYCVAKKGPKSHFSSMPR